MHCVYYLLQVLARICLTESEFQRVLTSIIDLFTADGRLLETRGSLIIRKLCVLLNAKSIYMALAAVLQSK
jgi:vacuole morphology and inheritance protein 14